MTEDHLKPLFAAVLRLFRPLVRILLRYGVSYKTFSDLIKWVYVDVASNEFDIEGRKQSISRVSVLTGLSRKEVKRVQQLSRPDDSVRVEKYNRAARVISAWRRERKFLDAEGKPAALALNGPDPNFSGLVKQFSGDVPVRATMDELIRIGAVEQLEDGSLFLLAEAYIPENSDADKLHILGTDVANLIKTIEYNMTPERIDPRFQRKVSYDNLPNEVLPEFRNLSAKKAQSLLVSLDRWLARHDRDVNPGVDGTGRNRAGIGIYYFEETYPNEENGNEIEES